MPGSYRFGFWKQPTRFGDARFNVEPVPEFTDAVGSVFTSGQAGRQWYYPPLAKSHPDGILVPMQRFELPVTHLLTTKHRPTDPDYGSFLVLALGFSLGLRLQIEGYGHLERAAIDQSTLVNFLAGSGECLDVLWSADVFWDKRTPAIRKLMFGAIHWYLISQSYEKQHEEFAWAYTVLDNLHRVAHSVSPTYRTKLPNVNGGHPDRPLALAEVFGLPLPPEFVDSSSPGPNVKRLTSARNALVHEARWEGEAIGYNATSDAHDLIMALRHFCSQAILVLLGVDCLFLDRTYDRQLQGLDIRHSVPRE